jgi:hypothetical protein
MVIGLLAGVVSAILFGVAAVVQAAASRALGTRGNSLTGFVTHAWRDPLLLGVIGAYLAGFVLHAVAIALTPLYLAQATISLSLPITAWVAARRLEEPLRVRGWSSIACIVAGLILLAVSAGAAGESQRSGRFVLGIWIGVLMMGMFAWRGRHSPPVVLATVAGFGYAGSALAVRGVADLGWASIITGMAVPGYGVMAFWLYSLALNRSSAAGASGAVIVYQTLVPSIVGLLWMGDGIRAGWLSGVVGGLVLALSGAVVLGRGPELTSSGLGAWEDVGHG